MATMSASLRGLCSPGAGNHSGLSRDSFQLSRDSALGASGMSLGSAPRCDAPD